MFEPDLQSIELRLSTNYWTRLNPSVDLSSHIHSFTTGRALNQSSVYCKGAVPTCHRYPNRNQFRNQSFTRDSGAEYRAGPVQTSERMASTVNVTYFPGPLNIFVKGAQPLCNKWDIPDLHSRSITSRRSLTHRWSTSAACFEGS